MENDMDGFEQNAFAESHYYEGGFKTTFIGDGQRPTWLPSPEVVGLDNSISLPEDGFAIEISRHLAGSRQVTWIGAYVSAEDLVYGARSNYVGIGVWVSDYLVVAADKLVDALIQSAWAIKKNGPSKASGLGNALLARPEYLRSWVRPLSEFPSVDSGLAFDKSGFPQTTFIDAGIGGNDGSAQRIATSLLCNQLILDDGYKTSSRLLYVATESGHSAEISKIELKPLVEKNAATQMLAFFSKAVNDAKVESERAYQSRDEAIAQLSQEKIGHSAAMDELAKVRNELAQLNGESTRSIIARFVLLQESLRTVSSKNTLVETAQAIQGLSTVFDSEADRNNLKRAMERLITQQTRPENSMSRTPERIALESGQSPDIRAIKKGIEGIISALSINGTNRSAGRSDNDEGRIIRSAVSQIQYVRRDVSLYLRILYPAGIVLLSLLLIGSFIEIYSLDSKMSDLSKVVTDGIKINNKRSELQPSNMRTVEPPSNQSTQTVPQNPVESSGDPSMGPKSVTKRP